MSDKTQLEQIESILGEYTDQYISSLLCASLRKDRLTRNKAAHQILDLCQPQCEWKLDSNPDYEVWEASCGNSFMVENGTPEENDMKYCSFCGGKLVQLPPEDTA